MRFIVLLDLVSLCLARNFGRPSRLDSFALRHAAGYPHVACYDHLFGLFDRHGRHGLRLYSDHFLGDDRGGIRSAGHHFPVEAPMAVHWMARDLHPRLSGLFLLPTVSGPNCVPTMNLQVLNPPFFTLAQCVLVLAHGRFQLVSFTCCPTASAKDGCF